jgi:GNAT superfamily N-acetyltransferase
MEDALNIRIAVPADAPRLASLCGTLGYPVDATTMAARLAPVLARPDDIVLVADLPSAGVVGWLHGAEQQLLECGRRCEILGLVVAADHRGRGAGRRLVSAVEEWAAGRGLDEVAVRSNVVRMESHPFYERIGFARVKTQHAYSKRLNTAPTIESVDLFGDNRR